MEFARKVATWRYERIGPLLDDRLTDAERRSLLAQMTQEPVAWPRTNEEEAEGREATVRRISAASLNRWVDAFKKGGLDALAPQQRSDKGVARQDRSEVVTFAITLLSEEPMRSLNQLLAYLEFEFGQYAISRSTLDRELKKHSVWPWIVKRRRELTGKCRGKRPRRRICAKCAHDIWQLDGKHFKMTLASGRKVRACVVTVIDVWSRVVLSAVLGPSENLATVVRAFRIAARLWGLPTWGQFDLGSAQESWVFRNGLATLGARRHPTPPKRPEWQGYVESWNRTLKKWFVQELAHQEVIDFAHGEELLHGVVTLYNERKPHRVLHATPSSVLKNQVSHRQAAEPDLLRAFLAEDKFRVHPKTGVVHLPNGDFRAPLDHAGSRVTVHYDPAAPRALLVLSGGREIELEPDEVRIFRGDVDRMPKRGTGQLQKLVDEIRGRRPNCQPGFGLPEVYQAFGCLVERLVPKGESEAKAIHDFYKKYGPLAREPFEHALAETQRALGPGRPITAYLDHLERLVRASLKQGEGSQEGLS